MSLLIIQSVKNNHQNTLNHLKMIKMPPELRVSLSCLQLTNQNWNLLSVLFCFVFHLTSGSCINIRFLTYCIKLKNNTLTLRVLKSDMYKCLKSSSHYFIDWNTRVHQKEAGSCEYQESGFFWNNTVGPFISSLYILNSSLLMWEGY